ncbi:MAG: c-type cytochrome [Pseudomonadota bacterium]
MRTPLATLTFFTFLLMACSQEPEAAVEPTEGERLAAPADVAKGRRLYRVCAVCHDAEPKDGHRVGPNLWGIIGAKAARHPDFVYSGAMKQSGVVWSKEALDAYITEPQGFIQGNRMAYAGMPSPADRRDLIAYLATLHDPTTD